MPGGLPGRDRRRPVRPAHRGETGRGGVPRRPFPQSLRLGLRARVRRAVRGRLPARSDRRTDLDPGPEALRHGAVRRRVGSSRHAGSAAQGARLRGEPLHRTPPRPSGLGGAGRGGGDETKGRRDRRGAGRPLGGARPRSARLFRDRLRGGRGAGRHDALRHPRVPSSPHAHPLRDRPDRRSRRGHPPRATARRGLRIERAASAGARVGLSLGGRLEGAGPAGAGRGTRRRRQGRRFPLEREPRLPHEPRPEGRRHRRRLRRVRRRAHGSAPVARGGDRGPGARSGRSHEGGPGLRPRGPSRRSERGDDRLARDLRRDAGPAGPRRGTRNSRKRRRKGFRSRPASDRRPSSGAGGSRRSS